MQSEGERLHWKLEAMRASYFVFSRNYTELLRAIEHFQSPDNALRYLGTEKRGMLRAFQRESMRRLHNYLAGAFTLVDHTRALVSELYNDHPIMSEYQKKVQAEFADSGLANFVAGLRNWMVHRGIVPMTMQTSLDSSFFPTSTIVLDINKLRSWDRWNAPAKQYLAAASAPLRLDSIVRSYHDRVKGFHSWLGVRISQTHSAAFEEWDRLREQYRAIMHGL